MNALRMAGAGAQCLWRPLHAPVGPIHFQLEPFVGCNLRCKTCPVPDYDHSKRMTLDQFRIIFDKVRPLRVGLSGAGEPMLNKDLFGMVRYAKDGGANVLTTTNFTLASEKLDAIIDSGLDLLKVSFDAARPETYEAVRGKPCFDAIVADLIRLHEFKQKRGRQTPYLRLQFVILHDNFAEIGEMIDLARRVHADSVYYQPLATVRIPERRDELTQGFTRDELFASLRAAQAAADQRGIGTNAALVIDEMAHYWDLRYAAPSTPPPPERVCLLPWFSFYVTVDGDVQPCCSFGSSQDVIVGNLLTQSLEEIWNGEAYRRVREQARRRQLGYDICRQCIPNRLRDFVSLSSVLPGFFGHAGKKD